MLSPVIKINEEKCNNCHMCISVCPVKFCIDGSGDKAKINHDLCIGCGRCIEACTQHARELLDDTSEAFASLKKGRKMIAVSAPAVISSFNGNYRNLFGWLKSLGVEAVFDVSFGAELTVKSYLEYIREKNPSMLISQPCPAIVSYIELYRPELLSLLAPADSPMLHTIKMVRTFYPEYKDHRIMVLSPCIAKRREFDDTGMADYNVTLAGISGKLESEGIRLESFPPEDFDNPPAERASLFSSPGGLMKTILRERPGFEDRIRKLEGTGEIYKYLDVLSETLKTGTNPLILDCLNCSKGCNGGPGTLNQNTPMDELEHAVRIRTEELKKNFRLPLSKKISLRKINRMLNRFWQKGLYDRKYTDRSSSVKISEPGEAELRKIYKELLKETDEDHLNCAACGYNSCRMMATAIHNGLNKPENCHHYKQRMLEIEKNKIDQINARLIEKITDCEGLISDVSRSIITVSGNMNEQSSSLESSSVAIEQMISSLNSISENFSMQSCKLEELISKARSGGTEMKSNAEAVGRISKDISSIGTMVDMIDEISQRTNLLSMNAAIEAAHAGNSGRGFAVVASEIKKLAENTATKANEVGSSLNNIIKEAGTTSSSYDNTAAVILEIISNILELTETMNALLDDVSQMNEGSSTVMNSIRVLKTDNRRVVDSATEISQHISMLHDNMSELVALAADTEK